MTNIVLPEKVTIQLTDNRDGPLALPRVLFTVRLFARHRNDFFLGPYVSNDSGLVKITRTDLHHDIEAAYESGLMDYVPVETCFSFVEIRLDHPEDIEKAIKSRTEYWTSLLKGEKERWGTIQNLLDTYRTAANHSLRVDKGFPRIRDEWNGSKDKYDYRLVVQKKT